MIIAIYDKNLQERDDLIQKLKKYKDIYPQKIEDICLYEEQSSLLNDIKKKKRIDFLFIEPVYGMELTRKIRKINENIKLIFYSSSPEYAVESYTVNAFYYFLKPVQTKGLYELLDKNSVKKEEHSIIVINSNEGVRKTEVNQIESCEFLKRIIYYNLCDGEILEENGTMGKLEEKLQPYTCFLKVHRSYIVNMQYISCMNYKGIKMQSGRTIPIPRGKLKNLKEEFLQFLSKEQK